MVFLPRNLKSFSKAQLTEKKTINCNIDNITRTCYLFLEVTYLVPSAGALLAMI